MILCSSYQLIFLGCHGYEDEEIKFAKEYGG